MFMKSNLMLKIKLPDLTKNGLETKTSQNFREHYLTDLWLMITILIIFEIPYRIRDDEYENFMIWGMALCFDLMIQSYRARTSIYRSPYRSPCIESQSE